MTQRPIEAFERHLSYDFKLRLGLSLDGNFWMVGQTSLNGVENPLTRQRNSRIGATGPVPLTKHQAIKSRFSDGAYTANGGNYKNLSVSWQYSWIGWPKAAL